MEMKQRLLLVDDEPQIRELLGLFLEQKGFEIMRAGNSAECLACVRKDQPHGVVLDINLAQEDGLKVLAEIKKERPDTRVVMLTGMGFEQDLLHQALQNGADGYVSKVLPMDELLEAIKRVL